MKIGVSLTHKDGTKLTLSIFGPDSVNINIKNLLIKILLFHWHRHLTIIDISNNEMLILIIPDNTWASKLLCPSLPELEQLCQLCHLQLQCYGTFCTHIVELMEIVPKQQKRSAKVCGRITAEEA